MSFVLWFIFLNVNERLSVWETIIYLWMMYFDPWRYQVSCCNWLGDCWWFVLIWCPRHKVWLIESNQSSSGRTRWRTDKFRVIIGFIVVCCHSSHHHLSCHFPTSSPFRFFYVFAIPVSEKIIQVPTNKMVNLNNDIKLMELGMVEWTKNKGHKNNSSMTNHRIGETTHLTKYGSVHKTSSLTIAKKTTNLWI